MTLWYRSSDDDKDPWHYVSLAISLARKMGLHRQTTTAAINDDERALLRRLWWCCVMRDYMIAYGMSRPVHIRLGESDVSVLTMEDFDKQDMMEGLSMATGSLSAETNLEGHYLTALFIKLVGLSRIVHKFLEAEDQSGVHPQNNMNQPLPMTKIHDSQESLQKVDAELLAWNGEVQQDPIASISAIKDRNQTATYYVQQCSLLHMLYHTAVMTVHRRHKLPADGETYRDEVETALATSRKRVRLAAREVITICETLRQRDLLQGLPMPFMSCLLTTCIVTVVEIKLAGGPPRRESLNALSLLWRIMRELESQVTYIDWSYRVLESACQAANIPVTNSPQHEHDTIEQTNDVEQVWGHELEMDKGTGSSDVFVDDSLARYGDTAAVYGAIAPGEHGSDLSSLPWLEPYEDVLFQLPNTFDEEVFFHTSFDFMEHSMDPETTYFIDQLSTDPQHGAADFSAFEDLMEVDPSSQSGFEGLSTEQDGITTLSW